MNRIEESVQKLDEVITDLNEVLRSKDKPDKYLDKCVSSLQIAKFHLGKVEEDLDVETPDR